MRRIKDPMDTWNNTTNIYLSPPTEDCLRYNSNQKSDLSYKS